MNQKLKTILGSILIGGMLLTAGGTVFADSNVTGASGSQKSAMDAAGKMMPGRMGGPMGMGMFGPMDRGDKADSKDNMEDITKSLVEQGIITQEIADKMTAYMEEKAAERKAEMEKVQSMTEEERKAYFESKKDSNSTAKPDPMQGLVEAGILTQDEADAINKYYQEQMKAKMEEAQAKRQEEIESQLDSLVSAGTITQEQKEKILAYLNEKEEARKAEMEKVQNMTEEERKAYFEEKKESKPEKGASADPLQELVDNGTLTQEQADAVAKALFQARDGGGPQQGAEENASN